ncbi:class F sortase [Streptomyces millisiae]|uniref:Class F sortase n=1 Tax=Streptomyces millisiae TaxID=3075542 RepID=A0ABU2LWP7_9ACTN|nr:class F sortase [Streptomyces sp. DSM 44918]MDT0322007.1 class F sortase [Streptomyces sp. DSM 44918]
MTRAGGRLFPVLTWALVLLAIWLWAQDVTAGRLPLGGVGTPWSVADGDAGLPPAASPLSGSAPPSTLEIESLGVRADIVERGVDAAGGVEPPPFSSPELVGWYAAGPTPGAAGSAVLVGHVDTDREPAVFYSLSTVEPGAEVLVTRADGAVAEFTVRGVDVVERAEFDAERVYGPRDPGRTDAELRLITCGGTFDRERGSYSANVVVTAYLTGTAT